MATTNIETKTAEEHPAMPMSVVTNDPTLSCQSHYPVTDEECTYCFFCGLVMEPDQGMADFSPSAIAKANSDDHYKADGITTRTIGMEHRYRSGYSKGATKLANPNARDYQKKRVKKTVLSQGQGYHIGNSIDLNGDWFWSEEKGHYVFKVNYGRDKWLEMIMSMIMDEISKQMRPVTQVEIGNLSIVAKQIYSRLVLGPIVDIAAYMTILNANLFSFNAQQKEQYESKLNQAVIALAKEVTTRCGQLKLDEGVEEPPARQKRGAIKVKMVP